MNRHRGDGIRELETRCAVAIPQKHPDADGEANDSGYEHAFHTHLRSAAFYSRPHTAEDTIRVMELVQIELARKAPAPKPEWLKARAPVGENYHSLKRLARSLGLHTVCESAQCPNIGECWHHKTATFMMLGNLCTRRCGFCAVPKGRPEPIDFDEPRRVAEAVATLGLEHAVITSVNRDDDLIGGARVFAMVIEEIRRQAPGCRVEVLIPDFQGDREAIRIVVDAKPEVLNHNTESVPRLYRAVRSGARYERTVELLRYAKELNPAGVTKSGVMVGLGEETHELLEVFRDLAAVGCDILTIGQYLRPSRNHLPMARLYTPREFAELKTEALKMGFRHVESGPLVRSSYHAHEQAAATQMMMLRPAAAGMLLPQG
jgi:lipoyl synthase